jgi:hypothetical protein
LHELVGVTGERLHLGEVADHAVCAEQVVAVVGAAGDVRAVVDNRDGLIDLELGAFDEVAEVRLEERQVPIPRVGGIGHRMVLWR